MVELYVTPSSCTHQESCKMSTTEKSPDRTLLSDEDEEQKKKLLSRPLYIFSTYLSACYYDKAKDIADKERDSSKNVSSQFSNHLLFSVLSQLCLAEKQYMNLGYLAPKRFLMKDTSLSHQYTHLYNEISRLDDKTLAREGPDNEIAHISDQIKNFIRARIALVDFYERLSMSAAKAMQASQAIAAPVPHPTTGSTINLNHDPEKHTMLPLETSIVPSVLEIHSLYSSSLTHCLLSPLSKSFKFELDAVKSLMVSLSEINRWRFYEALMSLDQGRNSLQQWGDLIHASVRGIDLLMSTSNKMSFFDSLRSFRSTTIGGGGAEQIEPVLLDWLEQLKGSLHSKFSLYFFEVLLAQTSMQDMEEKCAKLNIDYITKITTFQRRVDATAVSLVFDATPDQSKYMGPGFHHPDKIMPSVLQGLDLYPAPFTSPIIGTGGTCIPQDEVARHWPCVVKMMNDFKRDLEQPDKIVYLCDQRLDNTYYLMRMDPQMTMVVIFERSKMEREPQISTFLQEIAGQLRCTKLFASLKPGYK